MTRKHITLKETIAHNKVMSLCKAIVVYISPPRCLSMLTIGRQSRWNIRQNNCIVDFMFAANRWIANLRATALASLILGHFWNIKMYINQYKPNWYFDVWLDIETIAPFLYKTYLDNNLPDIVAASPSSGSEVQVDVLFSSYLSRPRSLSPDFLYEKILMSCVYS